MNGDSLRDFAASLDSAKVAGVLALAALGALVLLRKGFAGVTVKLGD